MLSDDGVDSPTYDGDIESSTTVGRDREPAQSHSAATSTLPSPAPIIQNLPAVAALIHPPSTASSSDAEIEPARVIVYNTHHSTPIHGLASVHVAAQASDPSAFSPEGIQGFIRRAINGELHRNYKINEPPVSRPVRIYADGTCLFRLRRSSLANLVSASRCIRPLSLWVRLSRFLLCDLGRTLNSISVTHCSFAKPNWLSRTCTSSLA